MAATDLQKLMFSISLTDQVTGPAGQIRKELGSVADTAKGAFAQIGLGAAGIAGAGLAMQNLLMPAIEMDRALGEVKSLKVTDDALKELSDTALQFSVDYGKSAADFVRSSYDIQSAIAGLSGSELSKFTRAGGVLAAATKADTATITDYMGTMYGIFSDTAQQMGKAEWVEQLAGQTALAVQMFKTDGSKMSSAFAALGASATASGRGLAEQMAVMGRLQATMSGSESATKYRAFLAGVGKAQESLGLTFTDSNGKMLGMVEILNAIKGKFGETIDVAEGDALAKAFGTQEAVSLIQLLMKDTAGLADNINQLGNVKGMETAQEMAAAMVDPWERLDAGIQAVKTGFGQALLPVINPLVSAFADGSKEILSWTREFPNLTRWIGYGIATVLGITAAMGAFAIASGLATMVSLGFTTALGVMKGALVLLRGALVAFRAVMLAVNIVMFANPIGLIVAGITALVAGIGAAIYWWNDLKAAFMDSSWGQYIIGMINKLIGVLNLIPGIDIGTIGGAEDVATPTLDAPRKANLPAGGIGRQISNAVTNNTSNSRSVHIGQIVTSQPAASLEQEMLMMGG